MVRKLVLVDAAGLGRITCLGSLINTSYWLYRRMMKQPQPFPLFLKNEGEDFDWICLEKLKTLKMPSLLAWKRFDVYFPVSLARRAAKAIPKSKLVVFLGCGHAPHITDTEQFNRVLLDYLNQDSSCSSIAQQPHSH